MDFVMFALVVAAVGAVGYFFFYKKKKGPFKED